MDDNDDATMPLKVPWKNLMLQWPCFALSPLSHRQWNKSAEITVLIHPSFATVCQRWKISEKPWWWEWRFQVLRTELPFISTSPIDIMKSISSNDWWERYPNRLRGECFLRSAVQEWISCRSLFIANSRIFLTNILTTLYLFWNNQMQVPPSTGETGGTLSSENSYRCCHLPLHFLLNLIIQQAIFCFPVRRDYAFDHFLYFGRPFPISSRPTHFLPTIFPFPHAIGFFLNVTCSKLCWLAYSF